MGCASSSVVCEPVVMACGNSGGFGCILPMKDNIESMKLLIDMSSTLIVHYFDKTINKTIVPKGGIIQFLEANNMFGKTMDINTLAFKFLKIHPIKSIVEIFKKEITGIRLAHSAWGDKFYTYSTFPILNGICALEFLPIEKQKFLLNDGNNPRGIMYQNIYLFPQTFCGKVSSLVDEYNKLNNFVSIKKLYDEVYMPLQILHSKQIVHNDIKFDNILLCNGEFRIIDFGFTQKMYEGPLTFSGTKGWLHPRFTFFGKDFVDTKLTEIYKIKKQSFDFDVAITQSQDYCKNNIWSVNDTFNFLKIVILFYSKNHHQQLTPEITADNKHALTILKELETFVCLELNNKQSGGSTEIQRLYKKYIH